METPYGDAKEEIPEDAPEPKGKAVRSTSFVERLTELPPIQITRD